VAATASSSDPFKDYLRVQRAYDAKIFKILEDAAKDIEDRLQQLDLKPGIGAKVRAAQLRAAQAEMRAVQRDMWAAIGKTTHAGSKAAAEAAQEALDVISRVAYASLAPAAAEVLVDGLKASAQAGINALYARVPKPLSEAVYRNGLVASGKIEEMIQRGIAQGLSAKELAASVYGYVSPTTPGGASYAANRLARTEINNAFHQQQIKTGKESPGVKGVKWNLSNSHPKPDECNQFAERDVNDLGAGVYKANNVPDKPHPHCFCYLTYVTMDPAEFSAALRSGTFDDELKRRTQINVDSLKQQAVPVNKPAAKSRTTAARRRTESSGAKAAKPKLSKLAMPKRVKGKDISSTLIKDAGKYYKESDKHGVRYDNLLASMLDKQGFSAKPGVATLQSDFDALIGRGWREVHRGTQGGAKQTASEAVRSFAYDEDYFPGTGIYGNGIYTSVDRRVAEDYAQHGGKQGETFRLAINPDAKTIAYQDLMNMQAADIAKAQERLKHVRDLPASSPEYIEAIEYFNFIADPGRYAASKGYDVIYVPSSDDGATVKIDGKKVRTKFDQYVILNRSVVVVELL
jgi:hypothetical protein